MATVTGNPDPGLLYADVLWDTSLLPAFVIALDGSKVLKRTVVQGLPASINGITLGDDRNPPTGPDMIELVSRLISVRAYGISSTATSGYNCLQSTYTTRAPNPIESTTGNNIPSRYVVMGGAVTSGTRQQQADLLQVTAVGQSTFLQTDWRAPPNYNQSPIV